MNKTRAYKKDIGKFYNMEKLLQIKKLILFVKIVESLTINDQSIEILMDTEKNFEVYTCEDCSVCEFKSQCLYKYNPEKDINRNKSMKINLLWETLKLEFHNNIQSEKDKLYRQIRSIQTERNFGDIKENDNFRKFNHRRLKKYIKNFFYMP